MFLWQDCASRAWSVRMTSGTAFAEPDGRLIATAAVKSVTPFWKPPTCSTPPAIRPSSTTCISTWTSKSAPGMWTASTSRRRRGAARVYNRHHLLVYESSSVRVNSPFPHLLTLAGCRVVDQGWGPALNPGHRTGKKL